MGKYFGTDGIRGTVGENLTTVMAKAIGESIKSTFNVSEIVIAKDTRESSTAFLHALSDGARACGVTVYDAGVLPTPALAYYSYYHKKLAVMITASHNPYTDNGIKLFNQGYKLTPKEEERIEAFIDGKVCENHRDMASIYQTEAPKALYRSIYKPWATQKVHVAMGLDMAHGATFELAPELLTPMVDEVKLFNITPDGRNINDQCGSTYMESLKQNVIEHKLDIGFAFDGDGDRVLAVDHQGNIVDGDLIIYVLATWLKKQQRLNKNTVVLTKMSNPGIVDAFNKQGIDVIRTDVGDKYVLKALLDKKLSIGGENSGHIIIPELLPTGDGIFIATQLLHVLQEEKQSLAQLIADVKMFPQKMVNVKNVDKNVCTHEAVLKTIQEVKSSLKEPSLVLIRPSGTEPVVRITISCEDETSMHQAIEKIKAVIIKYGCDEYEA